MVPMGGTAAVAAVASILRVEFREHALFDPAAQQMDEDFVRFLNARGRGSGHEHLHIRQPFGFTSVAAQQGDGCHTFFPGCLQYDPKLMPYNPDWTVCSGITKAVWVLWSVFQEKGHHHSL